MPPELAAIVKAYGGFGGLGVLTGVCFYVINLKLVQNAKDHKLITDELLKLNGTVHQSELDIARQDEKCKGNHP